MEIEYTCEEGVTTEGTTTTLTTQREASSVSSTGTDAVTSVPDTSSPSATEESRWCGKNPDPHAFEMALLSSTFRLCSRMAWTNQWSMLSHSHCKYIIDFLQSMYIYLQTESLFFSIQAPGMRCKLCVLNSMSHLPLLRSTLRKPRI